MDEEYDEYLEQQEEMYEQITEDVMNDINDIKEDDVFLNFGIKKEWVLMSFKNIINKYAQENIEQIK